MGAHASDVNGHDVGSYAVEHAPLSAQARRPQRRGFPESFLRWSAVRIVPERCVTSQFPSREPSKSAIMRAIKRLLEITAYGVLASWLACGTDQSPINDGGSLRDAARMRRRRLRIPRRPSKRRRRSSTLPDLISTPPTRPIARGRATVTCSLPIAAPATASRIWCP
jgi:hypothetical protein